MAEGDNEGMPDPEDRLRPQVPAWLYYAVILESNDRMPVNAWNISWWKALEGLVSDSVHGYDREMYRELLEERSEEVTKHRERY